MQYHLGMVARDVGAAEAAGRQTSADSDLAAKYPKLTPYTILLQKVKSAKKGKKGKKK